MKCRRQSGARSCGLLALFLLLAATPAETQFPNYFARIRLGAWLKAEHQKTKKDCSRLIKDSRSLRSLAEEHKPDPVPPDIFKRVLSLEQEALLLRADVYKVDENFLSVPVVTRAEQIRDEAKALQSYFEKELPKRPGRKLAGLADDIEDRADDIADRMRLP